MVQVDVRMNDKLVISGRTVTRPLWRRIKNLFFPEGRWFHLTVVVNDPPVVKERAGLAIVWVSLAYGEPPPEE